MNYKSKITIGSFPLLNFTWGVVHDCQWQVYSGIIAIGQNAKGSSAASDALIPFPDTIEVCAEYGVTCLVHTGGSIRDSESIEIANKLNLSFFTSGVRHFSH